MKNRMILAWLAIFAFLAIVFQPSNLHDKKETQKKENILEREIALAKQIDSLRCGDSLLIASEDYDYLLQKDSVLLGERLFINNIYPKNDYIWRNSKSLYEVRLREKTLKIRRFCDPEADEVAFN